MADHPDMALIRIGVTSQGKNARAASDANAREMTVVLTIKETGVADKDIQTTSLSLQPQYDPNKTGAARLIGFAANNQVTVKIRDIGQLPTILDRAISAGANEMSGIEFVVSEQSKLLDKARTEAIEDARRKAELYATAAGMKVGRVMSISEEGTVPPPRAFQAMRAGAAVVAPGHESDVDEALREVRRALLEADVALDVARAFTDNIKKQAIGVEVIKSVTPGQMVVKIMLMTSSWQPWAPTARASISMPRRRSPS